MASGVVLRGTVPSGVPRGGVPSGYGSAGSDDTP